MYSLISYKDMLIHFIVNSISLHLNYKIMYNTLLIAFSRLVPIFIHVTEFTIWNRSMLVLFSNFHTFFNFVFCLTCQIENSQFLEQSNAVSWNSDEPVMVQMQLPQSSLQSVEGHGGNWAHLVVAHLQLPHSCKVKITYKHYCKVWGD